MRESRRREAGPRVGAPAQPAAWAVRQVAVAAACAMLGMAAVQAMPIYGSMGLPAGAEMDLACQPLEVFGEFTLDGHVRNAGRVYVAPGGRLLIGTGTLEVAGDFINEGQFDAGSGSVTLGAAYQGNCGETSGLVQGAGTFHRLSATGPGYTLRLRREETTIVRDALMLHDVQVTGDGPGNQAYLVLDAAGTQQISQVGVSDVWAAQPGQWLAAGQTNQGGSGNAARWFGTGSPPPPPPPPPPAAGAVQPVPAVSPAALAALVALVAAVAGAAGWRQRRRRAQVAAPRPNAR